MLDAGAVSGGAAMLGGAKATNSPKAVCEFMHQKDIDLGVQNVAQWTTAISWLVYRQEAY